MFLEVLSREPKHGSCSATRRCRCIIPCDVAEQSATSRRHVDDMCLDRFCDDLSPSEYEARSKLPKKRRRVLPVEQPRRMKREVTASNRRVNAVKHPAVMKDLSPGSNKFGVNGMNMISLALQAPPCVLRPPTTVALPLQARAPIVESPIINTQSGAISLASLQPPLMTAPPLQPRPATTGALDLMLPLQPKLLPGYNLQTSYLSSTLSTVRPPDLVESNGGEAYKQIEVLLEKKESMSGSSVKDNDELDYEPDCEKGDDVDNSVSVNESSVENSIDADNEDDNSVFARSEINSNTIDTKVDTSVDSNDYSPNNNSH
ncbi:unnamed protein product [Plutella xylostella]|uniref:(diamondback moth) hypothetical protein n=1 Tax=Plutella xylostella TaxID=51655 RepID=A0A8S4FQY5_PLUXY|nr:unnamed protein product [Plutella xylostella]